MKNALFIIACFIVHQAQAQYKYYKDSSYTQSFSLLSGATDVIPGTIWDDNDFSAPIGFMFHMFQDSSTMIYNDEDISLGCQLSLHPIQPTDDTFYSVIMPLGSDLIDRGYNGTSSLSPISYKTDGVAPNRIFKMQWMSAGFYEPVTAGGSNVDSIDFQLWLYEGSDIIETRFGTMNLTAPELDLWQSADGPFIGIADTMFYSTIGIDAKKGYYFAGAIANPNIDSFTVFAGITSLLGLSGSPVSGMVFRFIPKKEDGVVSSYQTEIQLSKPQCNYHPQREELSIQVFEQKKFTYEIITLLGNTVSAGHASYGKNYISTANLPKGIYVAKITNDKYVGTYKFSK